VGILPLIKICRESHSRNLERTNISLGPASELAGTQLCSFGQRGFLWASGDGGSAPMEVTEGEPRRPVRPAVPEPATPLQPAVVQGEMAAQVGLSWGLPITPIQVEAAQLQWTADLNEASQMLEASVSRQASAHSPDCVPDRQVTSSPVVPDSRLHSVALGGPSAWPQEKSARQEAQAISKTPAPNTTPPPFQA
jgi:hypothetical protein